MGFWCWLGCCCGNKNIILILNRTLIFIFFPYPNTVLSVVGNHLDLCLVESQDLLPDEDLAVLWFMFLLVFLLLSVFSWCWKYKMYNAHLWLVLSSVSSSFEQNLLRWNTEAVVPKSYKKNMTTYASRDGNNYYMHCISCSIFRAICHAKNLWLRYFWYTPFPLKYK